MEILVTFENGKTVVFLGKRWVRVFGVYTIYGNKNNIVATIKSENVAFIAFADAIYG